MSLIRTATWRPTHHSRAAALLRRSSAWLSGGSAFALTALALGGTASAQQVVAKITAVAPRADTFTIEATLPVPPGAVPIGAGNVPLALKRGSDTYPTQLEVVSRYPATADGADVVELIARVTRPAGVPAGADLEFDVVTADQSPAGFVLSDPVRDLLFGQDGIHLASRDLFNNLYTADLLAQVRTDDPRLEVVRNGPHLRELRYHEVMLPTTGSQGGGLAPYPHMFGVHTFLRGYANEDFFVLDLVFHNGLAGRLAGPEDDPVHDLYFNQIDIQLPSGWDMAWAYDNPFIGRVNPSGLGKSYAVVDALPTGQHHFAPQQAQFVRRLVIARGQDALERGQSVLRRETRGFCLPGPMPANASPNPTDDLWSWWNKGTARFQATNTRLPHLNHIPRANLINEIRNEHNRFEEQVRTGSPGPFPTISAALGWSHPWGVDFGGMTGGDEIEMYPCVDTAWARHPIALRAIELKARAYVDRHPVALYDANGKTPMLEDHIRSGVNGPYMPFSLYLKEVGLSDYFGLKSTSLRFAEHAYETGKLPYYQKELSGYQNIDLQHLTRFLNPHLGLVWLANDSVAKLELELCADLFRCSFHQYTNNQYGFLLGTGLLRRILDVGANPGQGADFGRGPAWGLVAASAHYALTDELTRSRYRPWLRLVASTARDGQSACTGNPSALPIQRNFKGVYQSRQSFEVGFMLNAAHAMRSSVFQDVEPFTTSILDDYIVAGAYSSTDAPYWNESAGGQISLIAVRPRANDLPEFCLNTPENGLPASFFIDHTTSFPSWVYAYQDTNDGLFLTRATRAIGGPNLLAGLQARGRGALPDIAPMLSLAQEL